MGDPPGNHFKVTVVFIIITAHLPCFLYVHSFAVEQFCVL